MWPWRRRERKPDPAVTLAEQLRVTMARDARWRAEVDRARRVAATDPAEAHAILDRIEAECLAVLHDLEVKP